MESLADEDKNMSLVESEQNKHSKENDDEDISSDEDGEDDDDGEDDEDDDDDNDDGESGDEEEGEGIDGDDWDTEDDEEEDGEDEMLEVSDSDGESGDRCPICLNRFREQDIGTPESCDHAFCLECIQEWSKNVNTCPVDRQLFRLILCRHGGENNIYKRLPVEDKNEQAKEEDEEDLTYCEVCDECTREDRLLLCDGCDKGYHMDCLTPPLDEVPVNEWFCPGCAHRQVEEEDDEMAQTRPRRQVPRTQVMERVRSAIEELRVRRVRNIRRILSSSEEEDEEEPSSVMETASSSTPASSVTKKSPIKRRKRKTPRKYKKRKTKATPGKKRKTRKTTKRRKTTKTTRKGKKRRVRKGKRGVARTAKRTAPTTTVKSRIAGALGIDTPPPGRTIPTQKSKQDKPLESGGASLSIFGSKEELIHFDDDYSNDAASSSRGSRYSRSALSSFKPIGRVPIIVPEKEKKKIVINMSTKPSSSLDLLGSIMNDQSRLHLDSKHVEIQRDGSLKSKEKEKSSQDEKSSSSKFFKSSFKAVNTPSGGGGSKAEELKEEYDPAHPTDELDSDVEEAISQREDDKYDPAHPTDELDDVSEEEIVPDYPVTSGVSTASNIVKDNSVNVRIENQKAIGGKKSSEDDKEKDKNSVNAGHSDMVKKGSNSDKLGKEKKDDKSSSKHSPSEVIPLCKDLPLPTKDIVPTSSQKTLPKVKATETVKKVSPIKPFEISKKPLFEKKKLYGGEIDFSEDVTFCDAGFENFEVNVKAIESVFKGTVKNPNEKSNEKANSNNHEKNIVPENIELNENMEESGKENDSKLVGKEATSKSKPNKSAGSKETLTVNKRFTRLSNEAKDTDVVTMEEEDPIHEMRKLDKELDLELENPDVGKTKDWHKTRNDTEKDNRKSRRKVSIDRDEDGKAKQRKDGKERRHDWEEVEEGEVEDEQQYRERKKREKREKKRKLAAEKEQYLSDLEMTFGDLINLPQSEIDTRIVVQVSQNTDSRTVWEEDEKIRKRKDKEEKDRRKERHREEEKSLKKERKRKRRRSRSHSHEKRDKSRERKRSRSRDRSKRRHRDKSRSKSTDRSRKKKKKDRDRSRDKRKSRDTSTERVDIFGRSRSPFRRKDSTKDRDSLSPVYQTKYSAMKNKLHHYKASQSKKPRLDGEVILIDDDEDEDGNNTDTREPSVHEIDPSDNSNSNTPIRQEFEDSSKAETIQAKKGFQREVSSDDKEEDSEPEETEQFNYTDRNEFLSQNKPKQQQQNLIQIGVDGGSYDPANPTEESSSPNPPLPSDRSYTHTPTPPLPLPDTGFALTPTPPLPPIADFAPLFPPPPPGPPPGPPPSSVIIQDRPPLPRIAGETPQMLIRGPSPLDIQGTPPLEIRGPPPMDIRGPPPMEIRRPISMEIRGPPPLEMRGPPPMEIQGGPPMDIRGPPPMEVRGPLSMEIRGPPPMDPGRPPQGMMHQQPPMSLPINMNVVPPAGFHRGLPQTVQPQRQIIVNAFRPGMQRLPGAGGPRFGFNSETMNPPSFGSPGHPRPGIMNGPYDGLPPPADAAPPHSHYGQGGDLPPPGRHLVSLQDGDEGQMGHPLQSLGAPVTSNSEGQFIHLGQLPGVPLPRLPIPLLPTTEPPPVSVMVSMALPHPNISLSSHHPEMSIPTSLHMHPHPPSRGSVSNDNHFMDNRHITPSNISVSSAFGPNSQGTHVSSATEIPGLDIHMKTKTNSNKTYSQLEEISKLLNTQAKLMLGSNGKGDGMENGTGEKDKGVFKVPLPPGAKTGSGKPEVETTEVIDMDMASPILEEGNIELPVSPQFDNLIDTDDWLEEVYNDKIKKKNSEKREEKVEDVDTSSKGFNSDSWEEGVEEETVHKAEETDNWESEETNKVQDKMDVSEHSDKWMEIINNTLKKSAEVIDKASVKLDKSAPKEVKLNKDKGSTPVARLKEREREAKKESPKKHSDSKKPDSKVKDAKKHESKEKKPKSHHHHHHRKHKTKSDPPKENSKHKAEVDVELDLDSQELTSAVDMTNKEKYLRKLHLQERVVEEVKMAIKPHYANKKIDKYQYKEIMRKAVPKICHSKSGDINPQKIKGLVEAYVDRFNKPKHESNSGSEDVSPAVKSNGERAKTKTSR